MRRALDATRDAMARLPKGRNGWSVLGAGIQRIYRNARRSLTEARRHATDENLHELRKQTKCLWYSLRFLEPVRPPVLQPMAERVHRMSDRLGQHHDLGVLGAILLNRRGDIAEKDVLVILELAEGRRKVLLAEALRPARRAFRRSPGEWTQGLESEWRAWKSDRR